MNPKPRPNHQLYLKALSTVLVYVGAEAVTDAVSRRSAFNTIDLESGDQADSWLSADESISGALGDEPVSRRSGWIS